LISQLATGVPLIDDEVQNTFYLLDQAGFVPGARHLAREVKRNISLLEQARIQERIEKFHLEIEVPSIEEIEACLFAMKLADLRVLREEQMWDRVQAYRIALTAYDGIGQEPEL
jgi:catechol 2,3-dioxygenase-like lactoylglutathione lyase family enzyme